MKPLRLRNSLRKIGKRTRTALGAGILLLGFFIFSYIPFTNSFYFLPLLILLSYGATYLAILEEIDGIEHVQLFIIPVYASVVAVLFFYLLPVRLLTRIPFGALFFIMMYGAILAENIFNVTVDKSLPLYRAAYSIMNLILLILFMMAFNILYSFGFSLYANAIIGMLIAFPLVFHGLWIASPMSVLEERTWKYSCAISVILGFSIMILSFLPLKTNIYAIATTGIAYFLVGVSQEIMQDTAYRERIRQYIVVYAILLLLVAFSIQTS